MLKRAVGRRSKDYLWGFAVAYLVQVILLPRVLGSEQKFADWATSGVFSGRIISANAGCGNSSTATLIAEGLPKSFSSQNVFCSFIQWGTISAAKQHLLVDGVNSSTSPLLEDLLTESQWAPRTPANLTPLDYLGASADESAQFGVTCKIPGAAGNSTPVLLTPSSPAPEDALLLVVPQQPIVRIRIDTFDPLLGPSNGGTEVVIKGESLEPGLKCGFSNGSSTVNVTAVVRNSSVAVCTTPAWPIHDVSGSVAVSLTAATGGCTSAARFEYYEDPEVTSVWPLRGPRYGSFLLTVGLGASLDALSAVASEDMWPIVRISGADLNGSDLVLPANLTEDRQSLMAETPIERTPLAAGNHRIHISLNGQQYAEQGPLLDSPMLTVEGPALSMSQPYYRVKGAGPAIVQMSASLIGMSTLPVTANITVAQRSLSGNSTLEVRPNATLILGLSTTQLTWAAGESGRRNFTLSVGGDSAQLSEGAALVTITSAENADVVDHNDTSIVSSLDSAQITVGFALVPNQVVYRGENASIPVEVQNAAVRLPAAVSYSIKTYKEDKIPTYIPRNLTSGYLEWDLQYGTDLMLEIPIDWDNVTYETEDHLMITLTAAWNAQVPATQAEVGLHVFGVEEDQCPPGTFRSDSSVPPSPPSVAQMQKTQSGKKGAQSGWLQSIMVFGGDGWSLDLSSQFSPDIPEYGVIVPTNFANATLCVQPYQEQAILSVTNSSGDVINESGLQKAANLQFFGLAGGRRLQGKSVAVPIPGPSSEASTGVHALGSKDDQNFAACDSHSWLLPLGSGQNDFTITVGSLNQMNLPAASPPGNAATGKTGKAPSAPSHRTATNSTISNATAPLLSGKGIYTLSVVRLADPVHAEISELNITEANDKYSICSNNPDAIGQDGESEVADVPPCTANEVIHLNVSGDVEWVSLHPGLRFPSVQGLRVEIAGQVLSQGGNVGADQVEDTTAVTTERDNTDFLPFAYIVGLQPGVPVEVPIVVVAEDSVTSLRYFLSITRAVAENQTDSLAGLLAGDENAGSPAASGLSGATVSFGSASSVAQKGEASPSPPFPLGEMLADWPIPPSRQPACSICPAGWATTEIDESHCSMCIPGTFAATSQSPACSQCRQGTYANSWGSSHCNHCIIGTYAPSQGSKLCFMCPENMTNLEDGSAACDVPVQPGTNLTMRYAVIVTFGVYLNGTSLDDIAAKVGVNASSKIILEQLIRSDTAAAFNITSRDVNVTGISQVARRLLFVTVTATLGVDLPSNSSQGDIDAELAVKNLSADDAIDMLASQPDKFLVRTTKALDVTAEPGSTPPTRVESHPPGTSGGSLLPWYAILLLCLGAVSTLAVAARIWRKRSRRLYNAALNRFWPSQLRRVEPGASHPADSGASSEGLSGGRIAASGLTARGSKAPLDREPMFASGTEFSDAPGHA